MGDRRGSRVSPEIFAGKLIRSNNKHYKLHFSFKSSFSQPSYSQKKSFTPWIYPRVACNISYSKSLSDYFIPFSSSPSPLSMLLPTPTRGFFTLFVDIPPSTSNMIDEYVQRSVDRDYPQQYVLIWAISRSLFLIYATDT